MASRGINKVILIGNLGQDPEIRYMPNGNAVANFVLATSESWRDKQSGEIREKTEWHRVVIFGKLAEIAGEYLRKGSQVYIEGSLQTRKWQDQNGKDRYSTEVVVNISGTMQIMGARGGTGVSAQPENVLQNNPAVGSSGSWGGSNMGIGQMPKTQQQNQHFSSINNPNTNILSPSSSYHSSGSGKTVNNTTTPAAELPPIDFDDDIPF